jgi:hypothetical protein
MERPLSQSKPKEASFETDCMQPLFDQQLPFQHAPKHR